MAFVLVAGAGLGWYLNGVLSQRAVVGVIVRAGGSVHYDWEMPTVGAYGWHVTRKKSPSSPLKPSQWLIDRLGPDWFGDVTSVNLGPRNPDVVMAAVGQLKNLELLVDNRRQP